MQSGKEEQKLLSVILLVLSLQSPDELDLIGSRLPSLSGVPVTIASGPPNFPSDSLRVHLSVGLDVDVFRNLEREISGWNAEQSRPRLEIVDSALEAEVILARHPIPEATRIERQQGTTLGGLFGALSDGLSCGGISPAECRERLSYNRIWCLRD